MKVGDKVQSIHSKKYGIILKKTNSPCRCCEFKYTVKLDDGIVHVFYDDDLKLITQTHVCTLVCKCNPREAILF